MGRAMEEGPDKVLGHSGKPGSSRPSSLRWNTMASLLTLYCKEFEVLLAASFGAKSRLGFSVLESSEGGRWPCVRSWALKPADGLVQEILSSVLSLPLPLNRCPH